MTLHPKECLVCGRTYKPYRIYQKFCSKSCRWYEKNKRRRGRNIHIGGYNRRVYIILWLRAMGLESYTAFCHYCGVELEPDNFTIDHKIPRSIICDFKNTKLNIDNMVICCLECNILKGDSEYSTFLAGMEKNK